MTAENRRAIVEVRRVQCAPKVPWKAPTREWWVQPSFAWPRLPVFHQTQVAATRTGFPPRDAASRMEVAMEYFTLPREALTEVCIDNGLVCICQPEEHCGHCGDQDSRMVVAFSPVRARLVAKELLRLADEAEVV